jgi:hypothetical protein
MSMYGHTASGVLHSTLTPNPLESPDNVLCCAVLCCCAVSDPVTGRMPCSAMLAQLGTAIMKRAALGKISRQQVT